jgi:transcriptional regulator with XRE-family HTH domain
MENLKKIRLERGKTQEELAKSIGVSQASLSLYESGICEPSFDTLRKMAKVLDCTIDELLAEPAGGKES